MLKAHDTGKYKNKNQDTNYGTLYPPQLLTANKTVFT